MKTNQEDENNPPVPMGMTVGPLGRLRPILSPEAIQKMKDGKVAKLKH